MQSLRSLNRLTAMVMRGARVPTATRCLAATARISEKDDKAYEKAYTLFDADGDGSITPDELIMILPSLGETPGDLNLFFDGMSEDTITNHVQICDWLTFMIQNVNKRNQSTAEADMMAEFEKFDPKSTSIINADDLGDWIYDQSPNLSDDEIEQLVEGADVDGDGSVNYKAYVHLVCQKILKLDDKALKSAYDHIDEDGDGVISQKELEKATGASAETFEKVDFDHSGEISMTEFLLSVFKTRDAGAIREAFKVYDSDNSGKITSANLKEWCVKNGLPEAKAGELITEFDYDADGAINYEEFVNAVVHHKM